MFFVHQGHEEYGGELFGGYDALAEAGETVGRLAVSAFEHDRHNVGARSYTIIEAASKELAERLVNRIVSRDYPTP